MPDREATYCRLAEALPGHALFAVGLDGRVTEWNAGAQRLLGYGPDIVGTSYGTFFTPEDRIDGAPERELRLARELDAARSSRWQVRRDGSQVFVECILATLREPDGTPTGFAKLMRRQEPPAEPPPPERPVAPRVWRIAGRSAAAFAAAVGGVALAGWWTGIGWMIEVIPGTGTTVPATAAGLILLAVAVAAASRRPQTRAAQGIRSGAAMAALAIAGAALWRHAGGRDLGIDWLLTGPPPADAWPTAMASTTALSIALLAAALSPPFPRRLPALPQVLALAAALFPLQAFLGHLLRNPERFASPNRMGLETALALLALAAGAIATEPRTGLMPILSAGGATGIVMRRLLPAAAILLTVLAWLRVEGQHLGLYTLETGTSLYVVAAVSVLSLMILHVGSRLHAADRRRAAAMDDLERMRRALEVRVQERTADLRAEAARRAQLAEHFRALADSMPALVWTATPEGELDYVNEAFAAACGAAVEHALGSAWIGLVHPDDVPGTLRQWRRSLASGERFQTEYRLRGADGSWRWYLVRARPLTDGGSRVVRWFGSSTDVDDLKRAEADRVEALARAELERRRLRAVIDALPVGIFIVDADGRVLEANARADAIWHGAPRADSVHDYGRFRGWWPDSGRLLSAHEWTAARALRGETCHGEEIDIERLDGSRGTVINSAAPFRDAEGVVVGAVNAVLDITDRKEAERRLRQANDELDQFAAVASHDLQEPLRMVRSYLQLLGRQMEGRLSERERRYLAEAADGAERMMGLIRHLLEFSRTQRAELQLEPTSSTGALVEAIHNLQERIDEAGATVTHGDLPQVLADRSYLVRLFQNLVGNAVKYRRAEVAPVVHVTATARGREWEFAVHDNGIGIPADQQERIFDVFTRLHSRAEYQGTGLGLAICRRIVDRHGGRIRVESRPGEGSTFLFTLPAVGEQ